MKIQSPGLSIFGVILTLLVLVSWMSAIQTSDSVFLFTRKMNVLISYGYRGIFGGECTFAFSTHTESVSKVWCLQINVRFYINVLFPVRTRRGARSRVFERDRGTSAA